MEHERSELHRHTGAWQVDSNQRTARPASFPQWRTFFWTTTWLWPRDGPVSSEVRQHIVCVGACGASYHPHTSFLPFFHADGTEHSQILRARGLRIWHVCFPILVEVGSNSHGTSDGTALPGPPPPWSGFGSLFRTQTPNRKPFLGTPSAPDSLGGGASEGVSSIGKPQNGNPLACSHTRFMVFVGFHKSLHFTCVSKVFAVFGWFSRFPGCPDLFLQVFSFFWKCFVHVLVFQRFSMLGPLNGPP